MVFSAWQNIRASAFEVAFIAEAGISAKPGSLFAIEHRWSCTRLIKPAWSKFDNLVLTALQVWVGFLGRHGGSIRIEVPRAWQCPSSFWRTFRSSDLHAGGSAIPVSAIDVSPRVPSGRSVKMEVRNRRQTAAKPPPNRAVTTDKPCKHWSRR